MTKLNSEKQKYLILGLSKGTIVFVNVAIDPDEVKVRDQSLEKVYSRFSVHRQAVKLIQEVPKSQKLISICEENVLKIWGFEQGKS